jgi:SAM-dependent methyltransferase
LSEETEIHLLDIVQRARTPEPWVEGEKIPWNDPSFSRRMLAEHLSQAHDAASRRAATIDDHVGWIGRVVLGDRASRILDLGCGPGLYTERLARLGHTCVGIDFSPASIAYAAETADSSCLPCTYHLGDIREMDFGDGFDLVMLIFGEFNVFQPEDAHKILTKARQALAAGGRLLLEVHTTEAVRQIGSSTPSWRAAERGLFSDRPHLRLEEAFWDAERRVATERYYIVDAETASVTRYAQSVQAYTDDEYRTMLHDCGFALLGTYPSLGDDAGDADFFALVAAAD